MLTLKEMPAHSRIWVYQSNRELKELEIDEIRRKTAMFLIDWTSHGNLMRATVEVLYNRFVVVAADEQTAAASGCGIDKSVRFVQQLEKEYGIELFDRMLVAYRDSTGNIVTAKLSQFEQLVTTNVVTAETLVFNNMVSTKAELETNWEVPLHKSWHARMLTV